MVPTLVLAAAAAACDCSVADQVPSLAFTENVVGTDAGRFGLVDRTSFAANAAHSQQQTSLAVFGAPIERVTLSMGLSAGWSSDGGLRTRRAGPDGRLSVRLLGDRTSTFVLSVFGGHRALPFARAASVDGNVAASLRLRSLRYDVNYGLAHQPTTDLTEHVLSFRASTALARWFQLGGELQHRRTTKGDDRFVAAGVQATVAGPVLVASLTVGMADRLTSGSKVWTPFVGVALADVF
ncbi:MAG: hypothetical protein JST00_33445 [Deltaproteobacteria bacterium]|nr:hypothetical protein [Deltaproteobacteria bacterium]